MKHFLKVGAFISSFILFCLVHLWLDAVDLTRTYQRTKEAASSIVDRARDAAALMIAKAKVSIFS
jgi:hypothetical protein